MSVAASGEDADPKVLLIVAPHEGGCFQPPRVYYDRIGMLGRARGLIRGVSPRAVQVVGVLSACNASVAPTATADSGTAGNGAGLGALF